MTKKLLTLTLIFVIFTLTSVPVLAENVEYNLPDPGGILPDSPVYVLKLLRDQVTLTLIVNPTQKAFYYLFLSDKKMAAADKLWQKKNITLAQETALRSEEYFSKALEIAPNEDLLAKLTVSNAKHRNIIERIDAQKARDENLKSRNRVMEFLIKAKQ